MSVRVEAKVRNMLIANCNTADIRFHRFPKNPFYQQKWSSVCNRKNLNTKNGKENVVVNSMILF